MKKLILLLPISVMLTSCRGLTTHAYWYYEKKVYTEIKQRVGNEEFAKIKKQYFDWNQEDDYYCFNYEVATSTKLSWYVGEINDEIFNIRYNYIPL